MIELTFFSHLIKFSLWLKI